VLALVSAGCREQVRRGEAPALLTLVRDWVGQPGRREIGEALECAFQDDGVMKELPSWFQRENMPSTRVVCYQSLVTWPAAEGVWKEVLGTGVRTTDNRWWVDEAVNTLAATVETAEVRERLVTVVRVAAARHAQGFDTLRDRVCTPDPTMSGARRQTCAELASQQEADWRRQEASAAIEAARRENSPLRDPTRFVVASAVFAGGVAVAYATRNGDASRVIATAGGAVGGAALGFTAIFVTVVRDKWIYTSGSDFGMLLGATFAGGVLGGIAAYALTPSAWSRAPVTAAGLVVPYLLTVDVRF
jgi:hypothetical protein